MANEATFVVDKLKNPQQLGKGRNGFGAYSPTLPGLHIESLIHSPTSYKYLYSNIIIQDI